MSKKFVWEVIYYTKGGKKVAKRKTHNAYKSWIEVVAEPASEKIGITHLHDGSGHGYSMEIPEAKALVEAVTWALNRILYRHTKKAKKV